MKKIVLMVAVMMIAAPAMAQVDFVVTDIGDGQVRIGYTNTGDGSPNNRHPRGIAIEVEITSGDATFLAPVNPTISGPSNAFVSTGGKYNVNIDYLYTNGGGVGDGHPLAEPDNPGVYTGTKDDDEQRLAISLGFLDEDEEGGLQEAQTAATVTNLVTLQLTQDGDLSAWVTISADVTRAGIGASGVVGSNVPSTFPAAVEIVFGPGECFDSGHDDYDYVTALGMNYPGSCFCNKYQCQGDAAGDLDGSSKGGYYYVGPTDLNILGAAWLVTEPPAGPGIDTITNGICADLERDIDGSSKGGYYYVGPTDLNILGANWLVTEVPAGPGLPDIDCGGYEEPPVLAGSVPAP